MMERNFTRREKILLLILAVLLIALVYYKFIIAETAETIKRCDTANLENELQLEQLKAAKKAKMLEEMKNGKTEANGIVAGYNNIKNELNELNRILGGTLAYNISFEQPVRSGDTVRRDVNISFEAVNYKTARDVIDKLKNCKYRCMLKNITLAADDGIVSGLNSGATVNAGIIVTFYETMVDADTTLGLREESNEAAVEETTE